MKILITSFGAFLKNNVNSSLECMNELPKTIYDANVFKCELPVSYNESRVKLLATIRQIKPDIVISLGLAAGRKCICLERQAVNLMDSRFPDNDGNIFQNKKIDQKCENICKTPFDLEKIRNELIKKYSFISISNSAGTYVCNAVYFSSLSAQNEYKYKSIFIHLPPFDIIPKGEMVLALKDIIYELIYDY